jgi:hypothetical protein
MVEFASVQQPPAPAGTVSGGHSINGIRSFSILIMKDLKVLIFHEAITVPFRVQTRSCSDLAINPVNQLHTADLTLLELVQTIKHALKSTRANLGWVHSKLLAGNELGS